MPADGRHPRPAAARSGWRRRSRPPPATPRNRSRVPVRRLAAAAADGRSLDHRAALREFADELDDRVADTVAAALLLALHQQSGGVARVLRQLADGVARDVRARRDIEAERAEARQSMRMLLLIQAGVLGLLAAGARLRRPLPHRRSGRLVMALLLAGDRGAAGVDAPPRPRPPRTPVPRHHIGADTDRPSRDARGARS